MKRFLPHPSLAARFAALGGLLVGIRPADAQSESQPARVVDVEPLPKAQPMPVYFPPIPPPLDALTSSTEHSSSASSGETLAPGELAGYVGEIFYPPLGARLGRNTLTPRLRQEVERYRIEADALGQELRAQLEHLRTATPAVRLRALESLASRQAPGLAELENKAEQLRRSLTQIDHGWDDLREWHLRGSEIIEASKRKGGAMPRTVKLAFTPGEIAEVMRAAAFYYPHLLPAQRGLLREIALEVTLAATDASAASLAQPYVFFSPELARIAPLADLPANVAEKFARHQAQKTQLKKELYDAIYEMDRPGMNFGRNSRLKAIADRQASALVRLETLAEELRRELQLEPAKAVETSPLPPTLVNRIAALAQAQAVARQETVEQIRKIAAGTEDFEITYRFDSTELKFDVRPIARRGFSPTPAQTELVENALAKIAATYSPQDAEQRKENAAIRDAVAQSIGSNSPSAIAATIATALRLALGRGLAAAEYRAAVFEPGLSVEQRRLLFAGAIARLGLPLPPREMQPTTREARR